MQKRRGSKTSYSNSNSNSYGNGSEWGAKLWTFHPDKANKSVHKGTSLISLLCTQETKCNDRESRGGMLTYRQMKPSNHPRHKTCVSSNVYVYNCLIQKISKTNLSFSIKVIIPSAPLPPQVVAGDTDLSKNLGEATLRWSEQISQLLESVRVYQRDTSDKVSEMGEALTSQLEPSRNLPEHSRNANSHTPRPPPPPPRGGKKNPKRTPKKSPKNPNKIQKREFRIWSHLASPPPPTPLVRRVSL